MTDLLYVLGIGLGFAAGSLLLQAGERWLAHRRSR